jgi:curved DNA-binding protein CbpA
MTLYEILGVKPDASQDEIKKAFRIKAMKTHPDRPEGDEELFKRVQRAYDVLSDPEKRKRYDETGDDGSSNANSFEEQVRIELVSLAAVVMHSIDEVSEDLLVCMQQEISRRREQNTVNIQSVKAQLKKIEKVLKRLSHKDGSSSPIAMMMEGYKDKFTQSVHQYEHAFKLLSAMEKELKGYAYEAPESKPVIVMNTSYYDFLNGVSD